MAHSNYKVLTDVDLSNNSLLNVSNITNTEEASKSLFIETKGNTTLNAASLTSTVNGETSLETETSRVVVNSTAIETITTSKTTTVATTTTETINSAGVKVSTPSQTIIATGSSKVESPSIALVTGSPEGDGTNKQAKIALTKSASKDDSAIAVSARKVTVDATNSITQTAPESTYQTTDKYRKISLGSTDITLTNKSETVKLESNQTSISGTKLHVDAGAVNINNSTTDITSTGGITAKTDAGSELKILTDGTTLKSPEITLNGTGNNGVAIKSGDTNSSSIVVKNTSVNIDSKDTLSISADKGITLSDEKSVGIIAPSISGTAANGTIGNTAGTITLTTDKLSGDNAGSSTLMIDGKKTTLNTTDNTITATSITQTAPTSIYKADADNKLTLGTGSAEIRSGTEAITLTRSASTQIASKSLVVDADSVEVRDNKTLSTTSSGSVTVTARSSDGTSSVTINPTKIGLESKEVSLTASVTESEGKKSSRITLLPAASAEETALTLSTDKNLKINSVSGATIEDNKSVDLTALDITETAGNSVNLYSKKINLQNTRDNATEKITLNNKDHKISIVANNAGVDVVGDTSKTVTVTGDKFNVNSGKSMFAGDSEFSKNVKVVGNLTTKNMTGEAAELNSLDVTATTTVIGNLETGTANFSSVTATGATVTGSLVAGNGLTARGLVDIDGVDEHGKSLTINETASTDALKVAGELKTENGGVTSAGSISILNNGSADKSLTVNNTAEVNNLSVPGGTLKASKGMTSNGAVTVSGTTSVGTITGTGSITIPGPETFKATKGGTTGSVAVTETTIHTIKGGGSLEIPASSKLTVAADSTSDSVAVTSIEIATVAGKGSLEIPEGKKLIINNGGTSGTSATGMFKPTDVTINKIFGAGNLEVPGGKTLTASNGGTINGSMTIGKAGSTTTNLTLNGNATIGTSGANETTLRSFAKIEAKSTLSVDKDATFASKATFIDSAEVRNDFILGGVTIRWDSALGALTFSRG